MRILITGAAGNLGRALTEALSEHDLIRTDITGVVDHTVDIRDFAALRTTIAQVQPDLVLHPAAWTDVDGCAREPDKAYAINGLGTQNVAVAAAHVGAAIGYISSNEVFDGRKGTPYTEYDPRAPINPYGYSKYVGELAVERLNPRHYIVRTAWLVAHGGRNFVQAILRAADAGRALRVVTDEIANPTYTDDLAAALAQLIETERFGTYHLTNAGTVSRWGLARYVLDQAGYADTPVERISRHQWPRASTPPVYAGLANLAAAATGITLRPWQDAIAAFLSREGA